MPQAPRAGAPTSALRGRKAKDDAAPSDAVAEIPPLDDRPPRKVALLVEPTPFTHVSGYSNRFKEMLKFLKKGGDDAEVITPDDSPDRPSHFLGCPITYVPGFRLIFYKQVQLTLDFGLRAWRRLRDRRPNLIHAVAPGFFVLPGILYAKLLRIPLVISYHTHLPHYAGRYVPIPGLRELCVKLAEWYLPCMLNWGDLTLATSPQLQQQLRDLGCRNVDVWRKGIDTEVFSPAWNTSNEEMRYRMSGGEPHRPLLVHVGRLGAEKNIAIRGVLERSRGAPRDRRQGPLPARARGDLRRHRHSLHGHDDGGPLARVRGGRRLRDAVGVGDARLRRARGDGERGAARRRARRRHPQPRPRRRDGVPSRRATWRTSPQRCAASSTTRPTVAVSEAGREETLKWNWQAATSALRNVQYTRGDGPARGSALRER